MNMQYGFMMSAGRNQMNEANYASRGGVDFMGGAIHLGGQSQPSNFSDFMNNMTGGDMGFGGLNGNSNTNLFQAAENWAAKAGGVANNTLNGGMNPFEQLNPAAPYPQNQGIGANPQFNPFGNPGQADMSGVMNSPGENQPLYNPYQDQGGFGGVAYGQPFPTNYPSPAGPNQYGMDAWGGPQPMAPQTDQWGNPYGGSNFGMPHDPAGFGNNMGMGMAPGPSPGPGFGQPSNSPSPPKKSHKGKKNQ